jgi:hypothetical protein
MYTKVMHLKLRMNHRLMQSHYTMMWYDGNRESINRVQRGRSTQKMKNISNSVKQYM